MLEEKFLPLRKQKEINFKMCVAVKKCLYKNRKQFVLSCKCVDFKISYCVKCRIPAGWLRVGLLTAAIAIQLFQTGELDLDC